MGWGGKRPGAGRPAKNGKRQTKAIAVGEKRPIATVGDDQKSKRRAEAMRVLAALTARQKPSLLKDPSDLFRVYPPMHGVVPADIDIKSQIGEVQMAMDSAISAGMWPGEMLQSIIDNGLTFLGYPYLAELAQRPEYRVVSETIATEATRKWIRFKSSGDEDKTDKIKELSDDFERLKVQDHLSEVCMKDGLFGRMHLFLDIQTNTRGKRTPADDAIELTTDIGDGRNAVSRVKCQVGSLKRIKTIEPVWTYPQLYNATDPLAPDWYDPTTWYVMGKQIHGSRLLTFLSRPVPDLLKPAYSFGGLSLSQMIKPYVDIWLTTRQSVSDFIKSFSVMVLGTDMSVLEQPGGVELLMDRVRLFTQMRDNNGLMMTDKTSEEFSNVAASISGLSDLQAQAQEHMASVSRIPVVKLLGIQPKGLNATAEGELRAFYDTIEAYQKQFLRPMLVKLMNFSMLNLWGEVDPEIDFEFNPLMSLDDKEQSEVDKTKAETGKTLIDAGVISPQEERQRIAGSPNTSYQGLDVDDVPEPPADETGEGGGGDPDHGPGHHGADPNPVDGGGKTEPNPDPKAKTAPAGVDEQVVIPFGNDEWREGDHPRAPDGKFGSGGGSAIGKPLDHNGLKQVGKQMGSNPGGVFQNAEGQKFYIKKGQSRDHVTNELAAAKLFSLAGGDTLTYRPIKGDGHIATEMVDLDKNRASQLSPEEKTQARKDFVAHAWLANYDAIGTGGDNIGTAGGKVLPLDFGGALAYRARGAPKGEKFGAVVNEIDGMRDPKINPDAAKIYGGISDAELRDSAKRVIDIPDDAIREAVQSVGASPKTAETLIRRKADIAKRFGVQAHDADIDDDESVVEIEPGVFVMLGMDAAFEESKHPRDSDGKFAETAGGGGPSGEAPKTFKSKKEQIGHMLSKGTTPKEVMQAMGWPSVSMPQQAAAAGMKLQKTKVDGVTKYFGVPMTDAEKAEAKKAKAKTATAPAAMKPLASKQPDSDMVEVFKKVLAKASPSEIAKAKSAYGLKQSVMPLVPQSDIDSFNQKFTGAAAPKTDEQVAAKILAFKVLQARQQSNMITAKQQAEKKALEQKLAEQKAQAEAAKQNETVMKELGITEKEAPGFMALVKMLGGDVGKVTKRLKEYEAEVKRLGYPISGFQCALIKNYANGGYEKINKNLRKGTWTVAERVYVNTVNKALMAMPKFTGELNRGAQLPQIAQERYVVGQVVEERAFTSTSIGEGFHGNTQFKIKAIGRRAAKIMELSNLPGEQEVLFAARTQFHVTKVEGKPGGAMIVHMEELEDDD